jgi:hypothetical protein
MRGLMADNWSGQKDGGTLMTLPSGLQIVRRRKHEPVDFAELDYPDLVRLSDPRHGSKFLDDWGLERLTQWIAAEVRAAGWRLEPAVSRTMERRFKSPVGVCEGKKVYTIRIVCDGRYVHAYPIMDS